MAEFNPDEYLGKKEEFNPDAYLGEAPTPSTMEAIVRGGAQGLTANNADELTTKVESLMGSKDENALKKTRELYKKAKEAHPYAYGGAEIVGGAIPASVLAFFTGGTSVPAQVVLQGALGAAQGGANVIGEAEDGKFSDENLQRAKIDAGVGALFGGVGGYMGAKAKPAAEAIAKTATGATGREAEKFAPGAGRELLDRGIVSFWDSPKSIERKASKLLKESGKGISDSLKTLDDAGAYVLNEDIVNGLVRERALLAPDDSKASALKQIDRLIKEAQGKPDVRSLLDIEKAGRGFQDAVNYELRRTKPNTAQAKDIAARVYKGAVENAGEIANPEVAEKFLADKKLYGLVKPIRNAAQREASKLNQQQWGALMDTASAGTGALYGTVTGDKTDAAAGALAGIAFRRGIAPRLASSVAKLLDMGGREALPAASAVARDSVLNLYDRFEKKKP